MNYLKSLKFLKLFLFAVAVSSCAAQSTYRELYDAKEIYERARDLDPNDPRVQKAELRLESGERRLKEARFGRASKDFQEVTRLSNKVLEEKDPAYIAAARKKDEELYQKESLDRLQAQAEGQESEVEQQAEPEPSPEELSRMSLPAQALAVYLSSKNSPRAKKPTPPAPPKPKAKIEKMKVQANIDPKDQSSVQASEKKIVTASAAPATKDSPNTSAKEEAEASQAAIQAKIAPPEAPQAEEPPLPEVDGDEFASAKSFEPPRRRYPKDIEFKETDASLRTAEMDKLDEIGRYLIENPSNSLVLAGYMTKKEAPSLLEQRFQAIRAYLRTRGVPEDQVKLDPPRKVGPQAAFELYLIDH